jgi:hypothetical protein
MEPFHGILSCIRANASQQRENALSLRKGNFT